MNARNKADALAGLERVVEQVPQIMGSRKNSPDFERWHGNATAAIRYAFGDESDQLSNFKKIRFIPMIWSGQETDWQEPFLSGMRRARAQLESMMDEVKAYWPEDKPEITDRDRVAGRRSGSRRVFLIHGHDEAAKLAVERFLDQLDLEPVILAEQPSGGRTIIEKVEAHADVDYAVALLTADDVGSRHGEDATRPRARQNVIFELGYFIGCLGRKGVCALTKGEPEIPSDYSGVVYIEMKPDAWQIQLIRELNAAGFGVDANKVIG